MNYYNEWDPQAAAWLRELITRELIPYGYVDERSITEVTPGDLEGFTQCHFFAGVGGWSLALQLAGIPASTRLWTGSAPCQPFSVAGQSLGFDDPRHLAPVIIRLVRECRPQYFFGEQVAAAIGKHWLDFVFLNLEEQGYACGAAVLPACSVGAPHKRDRLFFGATLELADVDGRGCRQRGEPGSMDAIPQHWTDDLLSAKERNPHCKLADTNGEQRNRGRDVGQGGRDEPTNCGISRRLADTNDTRPQGRQRVSERAIKLPPGPGGVAGGMAQPDSEQQRQIAESGQRNEYAPCGRDESTATASGLCSHNSTHPHNSHWAGADWLGCQDGKFRPVEPGTFPLVDGLSVILADLRAIETHVITEIEIYASACKSSTGQILSTLRESLQQEAGGETQRFGMLFELYAPEVLLAFLFGISTALDASTIAGSISKKNDEACWVFLRELRLCGKFSDTPCGRQSYEPSGRELADPMFSLSFILARNVEAYWKRAIDAHAATGRVAMLRGAGNAIVPQVAAEFLGAFFDVID